MVISSIKDIFKCSISFAESYLQEPYYTSNTLRALQKVYSDCELYLIIGADTSLNIIYWHEGEWILNNFKFITVSRSNYMTDCDIEQTIDVSSTMIRELAQQEKILFPLVTKDVENLIKLNKLYK
jgi:nicotinic acid mononucleotide adenylyltransferase